jgi:hypothetical protein
MNKYIKNLAKKIALKDTNMVLVDAQELVDLRLTKSDTQTVKPLTPEQLTMKQLGSYLPNFEVLANQPESFRREIGLFCSNLRKSEAWKYLITHLKQDQVNLSLFSPERKSEDFVRGSINGIFVVDEQVESLGISYDENNKGIV